MKKLIVLLLLLIGIAVQAQDYETINKMQGSSLESLKMITKKLVNSSSKKFELYKEKENSESYLLIYVPAGLTTAQKEESKVNSYDDGVVFKITKTEQGQYKLREFFAEPTIMFAVVNAVFYPNATFTDFVDNAKYRDYLDRTKNYKFHFYSGDSEKSKYRFYSY